MNLKKMVAKISQRIIFTNRILSDIADEQKKIMQKTLLLFESYLAANRHTEKPVLHINVGTHHHWPICPQKDGRATELP